MRLIALCFAFAGLTVACGDSGSGGSGSGGDPQGGGGAAEGGGGAAARRLELSFEARVNGDPFSCESTFTNLGSSSATVEFLDFKLYVHDVRLVRGEQEVPLELEQDGLWQYQDLVLLDFEDNVGSCDNGTSETNNVIKGTLPSGPTPDRIRFKVGVPEALNHNDSATAPSPLNLSGMFWDWQTGYKFVRMDAAPVGGEPFLLHLASTDCSGSGSEAVCDRLNVAEIDLAYPADGIVVLDYAELVKNVDLAADQGGAPGCMSGPMDPECQQVFPSYGVDIDTGAPSGTPSWMAVK
jgi:uncharacterized repeat protein (TIGR04052 family)